MKRTFEICYFSKVLFLYARKQDCKAAYNPKLTMAHLILVGLKKCKIVISYLNVDCYNTKQCHKPNVHKRSKNFHAIALRKMIYKYVRSDIDNKNAIILLNYEAHLIYFL